MGGWTKLTAGLNNGGAQKTARDIGQFFGDDTRSLANVLFSAAERKDMLTFARALAASSPKRKAMNPRGSGYEARRALSAASEPNQVSKRVRQRQDLGR